MSDGKVYIIGEIGESSNPDLIDGILLVDVIQQVQRQKGATSLTVYIDSPGGDVQVGQDIYKYLTSLKVPIKTVGSNMVASIATVIFMAGTVREINDGCEFMIHLPMGSIQYATASELQEYTDMVRKVETDLIKFYAEITGMTREAVTPLLRNETWLTPAQLKSFGFITGGTPLKISAKATLNIHKPSKRKKMSKKKKNKKRKGDLFARMERALKKFEKVKALVLKTADQEDVDFYELEAGTEISVGDKARIDGKDADGTYTMTDGRKVTFAAGAVSAIEDADDESVEALKQQIQELTTQKGVDARRITALNKELKSKKKAAKRIKKLHSKIVADQDGRQPAGGARSKRKKGKSRFAKAQAGISNPKN